MSVLVYIEKHDQGYNKKSFELATYAAQTAALTGTSACAVVFGDASGAEDFGKYGITQVYHVNQSETEHFDSSVYTQAIVEVAEKCDADTVIVGHTAHGKALIGRLAVRMDADSVSGATALPEGDDTLMVRKGVFSGKAFADEKLNTAKKVISVMGNSIPVEEVGGSASVESVSLNLDAPKTKLVKVDKLEGEIPMTEAARVVSAGRGMKGPENWGIIEELAKELNAATACSRPVADTGWRPHHEHVGQTGYAIRPNLYIAIGISGAIQHLAGVNNSKTIVVINKDPEAPFFKAADYGVLGDLFDVVPRLIESVKKFKAENN